MILEEQCESKEVVFSFWLVFLSQFFFVFFFSFGSVYKLKGSLIYCCDSFRWVMLVI